MNSAYPHGFTFNEVVSLMVHCDTQEEIDHYWERPTVVPEAEACGWLKDRYGLSWQIVPSAHGPDAEDKRSAEARPRDRGILADEEVRHRHAGEGRGRVRAVPRARDVGTACLFDRVRTAIRRAIAFVG